jgi:hypothetical protein
VLSVEKVLGILLQKSPYFEEKVKMLPYVDNEFMGATKIIRCLKNMYFFG